MQKRVGAMEIETKNYGFKNALYEESPYGIIVFNATLNITDWNPAIEKLIGLSKGDCLGKNILEVFETHSERVGKKASASNPRGTLVVSESISNSFLPGKLGGVKVSTIVDKSGTINGGTLIITTQEPWA